MKSYEVFKDENIGKSYEVIIDLISYGVYTLKDDGLMLDDEFNDLSDELTAWEIVHADYKEVK